MAVLDYIIEKAKKDKKRIVLPESMDYRVLRAAQEASKQGIADITIIGTEAIIEANKGDCDLTGIKVINPDTSEKSQYYEDMLVELRASKGMTHEQAFKLLHENYMYYACMMVKAGDADGVISGACHSTADTLRPCLQIIKTRPGVSFASTSFLMEVPNSEYGDNGVFLFSDSVLEQNPDSVKLANIAVSTADTWKMLFESEPRVAMLSHSTKGSAKHADVDKVVEATKLAKETAPELLLDGELQLDAAIVPSVGSSKAPDSPVAGKANVLIFPDLDAGNIGYKLVQRLAKANAYGPISQGLAAPVNDLSRGCYWEDILGTIALTVIQAQSNK